MNRIYVSTAGDLGDGLYRRIYLLIKEHRGDWATRGATVGLAGGLFSIVLGALLWVILPILAQGKFGSFLNILDALFFVLPFPLLAFGACCLDLLEKRTPILPLLTEPQPAGYEGWHRLRPQRPHQN